MSVAVRFAPSPTGRLHIGNARTAVFNWLFARARGGTFLLRIDDTDAERSREEYVRGIEKDLGWLGLAWDRTARQSERMARYAAAAERLGVAGRLYPCYETEQELEAARRARLASGRPPIYDRAALRLSEAERARLEAEGRAPHWRFLIEGDAIAWDDLVRGPQRFEARNIGDPVLVRADGRPTYTLASVVDDVDMGITHVIRGEDHVANTAVQFQIAEALGAAPGALAFGHHPMLVGPGGAALSKRLGSLGLAELRERGIEAMTVVSLLARLGTADPVVPAASPGAFVAGFDMARLGRAPVTFDPAELEAFNHKIVAELPYAAVAERLAALGVAGNGERFWLAVRANCPRVADAGGWWHVVAGPLAPAIEDAGFATAAAGLLPPEPWDDAAWGAWTGAVAQATGRKGKALFRPLRLALTGLDHGPEMRYLLPLIGRDKAEARLNGRMA